MSKPKQEPKLEEGLEPIVFRDDSELRSKGFNFGDILDLSVYVVGKLDGANSIVHGHEALIAEGVNLVERVAEVYASEAKYSTRLKADIADYVSRAMTYLTKVEGPNHDRVEKSEDRTKTIFIDNFGKQLRNKKTRATFSYTAQIVDALVELAIRTGAIHREDAHAWKDLKQGYAKNPANEVITGAYNSLVIMKDTIRERYTHLHQLASK